MTSVDLYYSMADINEEYLTASEQFSVIAEKIKTEKNKRLRNVASAGLILIICITAFSIIRAKISIRIPENSNISVHSDKPELTSGSVHTTETQQTTSNEGFPNSKDDITTQVDKAHGNQPTSEKNFPDVVPSTSLSDSPSEKQGDEPTPPMTKDPSEDITAPPTTDPLVSPRVDSFLGISLSEWLNRSDVVWGTQDYKGRGIAGTIPRGTTKLSSQLYSLMSDKPQDTVYAVMVDFSSSIDDSEIAHWEYNGNTITSLQERLIELLNPTEEPQTYIITDSEGNEEIGYLPATPNKEEIAEIKKEIYTIRKAFLENRYQGFKDTFHRQGLEIYAGSEGGIVDYLVFYTFATKSKLENFSCKSSEAFVFLPAFDPIK